jgi:hypothetical protein
VSFIFVLKSLGKKKKKGTWKNGKKGSRAPNPLSEITPPQMSARSRSANRSDKKTEATNPLANGWSAGNGMPRWPPGQNAAWAAGASWGASNPPPPIQAQASGGGRGDYEKGHEPPEDNFASGSESKISSGSGGDATGIAGARLFLETERLPILVKAFEAFTDAAPAQQPRAVAFSPSGINITVGLAAEGRVHALDFPEFFWAHYRCEAPGFRAVLDLGALLGALTKVMVTHKGRCVRIMDQADNTLLVEGIQDDAKVARYVLTPLDADGAPGSARVLERAYYRYPMMLMINAGWISYLLKGIQQQQARDVELEFDSSTRRLLFHYTVDGAPISEGDQVPLCHVLQNPFLPARLRPIAPSATEKATVEDQRVVCVREGDVACPAGTTAEAATRLSEKEGRALMAALTGFKYRERFRTRSLWLPVKRPKLSAYVNLFLAPGEPLLMQSILDVDSADARRSATYSSWLRPFRREENPQLGLGNGGSAAVLDQMVRLAPRIRGPTETLRAASAALQESANLRDQRPGAEAEMPRIGMKDEIQDPLADTKQVGWNNSHVETALKDALSSGPGLSSWPAAETSELPFPDGEPAGPTTEEHVPLPLPSPPLLFSLVNETAASTDEDEDEDETDVDMSAEEEESAEPIYVVKPKSKSKAKTKLTAESKAKTKPPASESKAKTKPPASESKAKTKPPAESKAKTKPPAESKAKTKPSAESKAKTKPSAESKAKSVSGSKSKSKSKPPVSGGKATPKAPVSDLESNAKAKKRPLTSKPTNPKASKQSRT